MGERQAPFVAVRTDIRKEERVLVIADIAGYSRHEALGRLIDMWAWCADRKLEDAPEDCEGYAVPDAVVCRFLGPQGVRAILGDHVDEFAMGERRPDGLIYLRGTADTVSRLRAARASASAGGNARTSQNKALRRRGQFVTDSESNVAQQTIEPAVRVLPTSCKGAAHQPDTSREGAVTSEIPDPDPDPIRDMSGKPDLGLPDPAAELAKQAVAEINRISGRGFTSDNKSTLKLCRGLLRNRHTSDEVLLVIRSKSSWVGDPKMDGYFSPGTLLGPEKFERYLDEARAGPSTVPLRLDGTRPPERPNPIKPWT